MKKVCKICKKDLPIEDFVKNGIKNDKQMYKPVCKTCYYGHCWEDRLLRRVATRTCSTAKIGFLHGRHNLTKTFLLELMESQDYRCHWTNVKLDLTFKNRLRMPTVDRVDNNKGYTQDNVVISSYFFNVGRNNATVEDCQEFILEFKNNLD